MTAAALERLDYRVNRLLARVGDPRDARTHLVTRAASFPACQPLITAITLPASSARPTLALAIGGAVLLLVLNRLGWRIAAALFDRERLILGTR